MLRRRRTPITKITAAVVTATGTILVWPCDWVYSADHFSAFDRLGLADRLEGWDVTARLPEIWLPCLVTAGKCDVVSPKCAQAIHRGIKGCRSVMSWNGFHLPMW